MNKLLSTTALVLTLAFSGMASADPGPQGKDEHGHGMMHPAFMDVLPRDKAAQFRETMQQAQEKNLILLDQEHKLHEELHDIITAPKFDKNAYLSKSDELRKFRETMHDSMRANRREAFATALGQLPQEDRQALAAAMDRMHHGHDGEHPHWDHEHGDGHHMPHEPMEKPPGNPDPDQQ